MAPRTLLIASCAFGGRLDAERVAGAVARGLQAGGWPSELCPLEDCGTGTDALRAQLEDLNFDRRMRAAHAVIVCEAKLRESTLAGSPAFEIATRARQAGVPAYAVTSEDRLDSFDARILDLQRIFQAGDMRTLSRAGRKLAEIV